MRREWAIQGDPTRLRSHYSVSGISFFPPRIRQRFEFSALFDAPSRRLTPAKTAAAAAAVVDAPRLLLDRREAREPPSSLRCLSRLRRMYGTGRKAKRKKDYPVIRSIYTATIRGYVQCTVRASSVSFGLPSYHRAQS